MRALQTLEFLIISILYTVGEIRGDECSEGSRYNICNFYVKEGKFCRSSKKVFYYAFNKCYEPSEVPKRDLDAASQLPTGHNFILNDDFSDQGFAYGVHVSGLMLPAHMYHAVIKFKISEEIVSKANADISTLPPPLQFRSIRYNEKAIKLVDLIIFGEKEINGNIAKSTGPLYQEILKTKISIYEIVDFRRYDALGTPPNEESYVLFGDNSAVYASHIPTTCGDYQELLEIKLIGFPTWSSLVKYGEIIRIDKTEMKAHILGGDRIGNELSVKYDARSLEYDLTEKKIKIKKVIFHDRCIINLLCPELKNVYSCPEYPI